MAAKQYRRAALLALAAARRWALAQPAAAQVSLASGVDAGELEVPINKSQVLRADRPYSKALIGNPEIADIVPISDTSRLCAGQEERDHQPDALRSLEQADRGASTWSSGPT